MNVVPLALRTEMVKQRINSEVEIKVLVEPMNIITHWALALVKGIREPHEVKKKSFEFHSHRGQNIFSLPRVVP